MKGHDAIKETNILTKELNEIKKSYFKSRII